MIFAAGLHGSFDGCYVAITASANSRAVRIHGWLGDPRLDHTGDARYDRLYAIITHTVLEGSANFVRGRFAANDLADKAPVGAELMTRFVDQVVEQGDLESADALISEGLQGNGPL